MQPSQKNLLFTLIGGVLLWAAWPVSPFTLLIFVGWLPLLFIVEHTQNWKKLIGYTFLHMFIWNILTTWWVAKASIIGGVSAFLVNSLVMSIPWLLYYFTKKQFKGFVGNFSIIAYYLVFEYVHHNWDLSWPWLTLGNVFATHPAWVQWYEYTGTTGGSLWVLLSNVLVFRVLQLYQSEGRTIRYFSTAILWIALLFAPILFSFFIKNNLTLLHNKYNVVVLQPNIDPYTQKFEAGSQEAQLQKLISLSQREIDKNTALVVWPETAIPFQTNEQHLKENFALLPLWSFLKNNPTINLLTGLEGFNQFETKVSHYAKPFINGGGFYEMYNTAVLMDSSHAQFYHKSKLVPGVEVLPSFLSFMAPAFEKFGGTGGGYTPDAAAHIFAMEHNTFQITPAICYESIYGDYLASFNRQGATLICIITNDGWWGDTQGYKQHMNYARLRAIESRKWVARSANTGISCFIDPYGNVVQQLGWNKEGALKQQVAAYTSTTFYTQHGDWISKIMWVITAILLGLSVLARLRKKMAANP